MITTEVLYLIVVTWTFCLIYMLDSSRATGLMAEGIHVRQKPEFPVLQLICNTSYLYQVGSLYKAIDHPSHYECSHRIYYIKNLIVDQQLVCSWL